jgi:phosphonate transport system substrate-binding protein
MRGIATGVTRRAALGVAGAMALAPAARAERTVTFGLTPVFLDSDIVLIGQIEAYLTARLGRPVQLVKRRTYQEITSLLVAGQLDAAWICGYPFVRHRAALRLLAVPLHRGAPLYRSHLIARAGRSASGLADLRGDIHAFSDPDSNSGYLVTRVGLADLSAAPATFFRRTLFTHGHRNVIRAVSAGLADSGSVDGYVYDVLREIDPALVAATRVVAVSEQMGFPPIAAPAAGDPAVAEAISSALIDMPRDAVGREILATLRLDGFLAADNGLFDGIARLARRVGGEE